ncbi:MAG TPA: N-acetyl-gamma-glutamyl-phosphate reductase [Polyangiaceae bacterium]|nr:N-acetyl-gamma-glutamyl-phosphate reductase [Polyangiaceae bacterium]
MKRFKAAVLGGSGFAGAELVRHLLQHPDVELVRVCALDHVGEPLASAHPHLEGQTELVFENLPPRQAAEGVDIVLMGLPHQASFDAVDALIDSDVRLIDMSGAFRLKRAGAYAEFYGASHPRPELLEGFVYGLPELNRERIRQARFVASPGCFATTVELSLLPLARLGLLGGEVQTVAITGSSGSGVAPSVTTHHPTRALNLRTYRPLQHQHVPEIEDTLRAAGASELRLSFVPVSAPLSRGIFATSFVHVPASLSQDDLRILFEDSYRQEPFVRVPRSRLPEVIAVAGSNYVEVGCVLGAATRETRLVSCFAALDNLVKGGAGQAIQNMNLMLGLDESLTLGDPGSYP